MVLGTNNNVRGTSEKPAILAEDGRWYSQQRGLGIYRKIKK